jgi:outer membrane receptor protein involved in Fe transport
MGAATDENGDYFIANVPVGSYTLRATMIGYSQATVLNVQVSTNLTTTIDLTLQQEAIAGEELTIVAERPVVELDNTSSIVVMSTEEIITQPTSEFTDVLMTLPSVNMEGGVMKFRGGGLEEVAFILDGARVRNPVNHSPYTRMNLSSIQEVEVITGAFNAEYGEARSGVVNVITKDGSDHYEFFIDTRAVPPGKKHWGVALYDLSTDLYWENANARHWEWWVENTDQWVDNNGRYGYDPLCEWTPEEAWENYLDTHQPLTDYTNTWDYQTEASVGGPVPLMTDTYFFLTGKYRSKPPLYGNAYRDRGVFFDGTYKISTKISPKTNLALSGFYGTAETSWGVDDIDYGYASSWGITSRYAYFDYAGLPESKANGQTLRISHLYTPQTVMELQIGRVGTVEKLGVFPADSLGWDASGATLDNLRGVDSSGFPIYDGRYMNNIGYHTLGYWYRYDDRYSEWTIKGDIASQVNKSIHLKTGFEFIQYFLDHWNESKLPARVDSALYKPYQGAVYAQGKLEFGGLIMNAGLRFDFYNPNDTVYKDIFDPFNGPKEHTKTFTQLSPRLGLSHPINENSVLHFSYGHFFQRPHYADYGEGNDWYDQLGSLTTFRPRAGGLPHVLGNRELEPTKTVAFEVGYERSFANSFVIDFTGYYKDIRNTIRSSSVYPSAGGSYATNSNGNYADVKGFEISLRKVPTLSRIGTIWGYVNYTTQIGITGRSGDPRAIIEDGSTVFEPSGDGINYNNPRLKAGIYYESPADLPFFLRLLSSLSVSLEYQAVYPNENILSDVFKFEGKSYLRPTDENANLRVKKVISLLNGNVIVRPYLEIHNLFNHKWIYFPPFENTLPEEQREFVESDFEYIPTHDANGVPFLDVAKYRNLPRSIFFGATVSL